MPIPPVTPAKLVTAAITFVTPSASTQPDMHDDKDWDTEIEITLFDSGGNEILYNRWNEGIRYPDDGSAHSVYFPIPQGDQTPDASSFSFFCLLFMHIYPKGDDTWYFYPSVYLAFDDGSTKTFYPQYPDDGTTPWMLSEFSPTSGNAQFFLSGAAELAYTPTPVTPAPQAAVDKGIQVINTGEHGDQFLGPKQITP